MRQKRKFHPFLFIAIWVSAVAVQSCSDDEAVEPESPTPFQVEEFEAEPVAKTNPARLYAHYMPWYQSLEVDGYWGSHWTMANRDPELTNPAGQREIASHYYPLIGPYSSKDPDLVEYHLLLMKYSGIDGFLVDWYGSYNVYDYPANLNASNAIIDVSGDVGLEFGIVYEDRTTEQVVAQGSASSPEQAAASDMAYMQNHYFSRPNYIQLGGENLLMVFSPVFIETPAQWTQIFSNISPKPTFLTLWYESADAGENADGEYPWIYSDYLKGLENFYVNRAPSLAHSIGVAYPGFQDFYAEGGWGDALGWTIDHENALDETLALATEYDQTVIQLATWNDFGEGTMLEPTAEIGYQYLETIQQYAGVAYTSHELELIFQLYQKRKSLSGNDEAQLKLDQVYYFLISLQVEEAEALLNEI